MFENGFMRRNQPLIAVGAVFAAALIGAAVPVYMVAVADALARMVVPPVLVLLCFILAFSRKSLLLLIILWDDFVERDVRRTETTAVRKA